MCLMVSKSFANTNTRPNDSSPSPFSYLYAPDSYIGQRTLSLVKPIKQHGVMVETTLLAI